MRLRTRVLVSVNKGLEHWEDMDLPVDTSLPVIKAKNKDYSVVLINGQQCTIEYPFELLIKQIAELADDTNDSRV